MTTECCVCYSTTEDINAKYAASFVTIPCGGKHVVCFPCLIKNENHKCPMCRYDYVAGVWLDDEEDRNADEQGEANRRWEDELVRFQQHDEAHPRQHQQQLEDEERMRQEEEQMQQEEEAAQLQHEEFEERWMYDEPDYTFYRDLNREFNGNYQQAVEEAARIWKDFARLDQATQDSIYEKLEQAAGDKFYIYSQLRRDMYRNEDGIIGMFISSFDVCRVVYLSKIITQPDNEEAYKRLKEYEEWVNEELDNAL